MPPDIWSHKTHRASGNSFNVQLTQKWLKICIFTHRQCSKYGVDQRPALPRRVLDVKGQTIQLHYSHPNENSVYACLSYAWGGPQLVMLTISYEKSLQAGVALAGFPPTIRDAIVANRGLNLQYLWIDALCILQDSEEDKEAELKGMHDYYRNTTLCLQPTGVTSVHDSFINPTKSAARNCEQDVIARLTDLSEEEGLLSSLNDPRFEVFDRLALHVPQIMPFYDSTGQQFKVMTEFEPDLYSEHDEPLHRRAWMLQETLLSRRLLIFPKHGGLVWRCEETEDRDGKLFSYSPNSRYNFPKDYHRKY